MKPTQQMIDAGGAVLSTYENREYSDVEQAPTLNAIAEQVFSAMQDAQPPELADDAPMVDPFDRPEIDLGKMEAHKLQSQLRDNLLDVLRTMPNTWQKLNEGQKRSLAARCAQFSATAIFQTAHKIAGIGNTSMGALLKEVKFTDKGVDVKLAAVENDSNPVATSDLNHTLVDFQGKNIVLVFVDPAAFNEMAEDAKIEADEPPLPMGEKHPAQGGGSSGGTETIKAGEVETPLVEPEGESTAGAVVDSGVSLGDPPPLTNASGVPIEDAKALPGHGANEVDPPVAAGRRRKSGEIPPVATHPGTDSKQ